MTKPENYTQFEDSLRADKPRENWPETLKSLWFIAKGDWEASHNIAQDINSPMGSLIHAHLHRIEGDDWNAKYWYRQAGRTFPNVSLDTELKQLVEKVLIEKK
ncbi:hypothetical protein DSM03_101286 [Leeuwenhoekiella aestuarii]|uniref:Uncharacterized protein n=1 Tax=Leeuwenhoekiella aestuarii TaxID=2249426 RepID=A0A4Q0NSV5_9FLAO|nr:hypothetical protein [Leeuwenhoekiella aestuarii]RXG14169.1 hypothetical protein DSM04_104277 [Leeuwenhoekiella aestuarii]RXG18918.1 hypothetical protein DSM03_101286 [Leeuwenhoekiella aestuarii]